MPSVWKGDNNNIYTLTLTDGSIVQLRVQNDVIHQQEHLLTTRTAQDDLANLESCCWLQNDSDTACTHCEGRQQVDGSSSLPDVGEEVILPISSLTIAPESLKSDLQNCHPSMTGRGSLSPVSPQEVMPIYTYTKTLPTTPKSTLFDMEETDNEVNDKK